MEKSKSKPNNVSGIPHPLQHPLNEAISTRNFRLLERLLECGYRSCSQDHNGLTPLQYAIDKGCHEGINILVQYGLSPEEPGHLETSVTSMLSPLEFFNFRVKFQKLSKEHGINIPDNLVKMAQIMLKIKDDILNFSETLVEAILSLHVELVGCLLDHGVPANQSSPGKCLPLELAMHNFFNSTTSQTGDCLTIMKSLIEHEGDVNVSSGKISLLQTACVIQNPQLMELLLQSGAHLESDRDKLVLDLLFETSHCPQPLCRLYRLVAKKLQDPHQLKNPDSLENGLKCMELMLRVNCRLDWQPNEHFRLSARSAGTWVHTSPFDHPDTSSGLQCPYPLAWLMLQAGSQWKHVFPTLSTKDVNILREQGFDQPRSLALLCRDAIRRELGSTVTMAIENFAIPSVLREFLLLDDVFEEFRYVWEQWKGN